MSDDDSGNVDVDREAILARRRRFMALTLTALSGTALTATACPCLKVAAPPGSEPTQPDPAGPRDGASESPADRDDEVDDGDSPEEAQPGQ